MLAPRRERENILGKESLVQSLNASANGEKFPDKREAQTYIGNEIYSKETPSSSENNKEYGLAERRSSA